MEPVQVEGGVEGKGNVNKYDWRKTVPRLVSDSLGAHVVLGYVEER